MDGRGVTFAQLGRAVELYAGPTAEDCGLRGCPAASGFSFPGVSCVLCKILDKIDALWLVLFLCLKLLDGVTFSTLRTWIVACAIIKTLMRFTMVVRLG